MKGIEVWPFKHYKYIFWATSCTHDGRMRVRRTESKRGEKEKIEGKEGDNR